jgi:hypothetical protein
MSSSPANAQSIIRCMTFFIATSFDCSSCESRRLNPAASNVLLVRGFVGEFHEEADTWRALPNTQSLPDLPLGIKGDLVEGEQLVDARPGEIFAADDVCAPERWVVYQLRDPSFRLRQCIIDRVSPSDKKSLVSCFMLG